MSPLDFLITTFRNEDEPTSVRVDAARTVCQFIYPRLQSVDLNGHDGAPLQVSIVRFSDVPLAEQVQHADRLIDVTPESIDAIDDDEAA